MCSPGVLSLAAFLSMTASSVDHRLHAQVIFGKRRDVDAFPLSFQILSDPALMSASVDSMFSMMRSTGPLMSPSSCSSGASAICCGIGLEEDRISELVFGALLFELLHLGRDLVLDLGVLLHPGVVLVGAALG